MPFRLFSVLLFPDFFHRFVVVCNCSQWSSCRAILLLALIVEFYILYYDLVECFCAGYWVVYERSAIHTIDMLTCVYDRIHFSFSFVCGKKSSIQLTNDARSPLLAVMPKRIQLK